MRKKIQKTIYPLILPVIIIVSVYIAVVCAILLFLGSKMNVQIKQTYQDIYNEEVISLHYRMAQAKHAGDMDAVSLLKDKSSLYVDNYAFSGKGHLKGYFLYPSADEVIVVYDKETGSVEYSREQYFVNTFDFNLMKFLYGGVPDSMYCAQLLTFSREEYNWLADQYLMSWIDYYDIYRCGDRFYLGHAETNRASNYYAEGEEETRVFFPEDREYDAKYEGKISNIDRHGTPEDSKALLKLTSALAEAGYEPSAIGGLINDKAANRFYQYQENEDYAVMYLAEWQPIKLWKKIIERLRKEFIIGSCGYLIIAAGIVFLKKRHKNKQTKVNAIDNDVLK